MADAYSVYRMDPLRVTAPGDPSTDISGCCNCPGLPTDHRAYRAELAGLYGLLVALHRLEAITGETFDVELACDGLSALRQVSHPSPGSRPFRSYWGRTNHMLETTYTPRFPACPGPCRFTFRFGPD